MDVLNPEWLPACKMRRIIFHWTGGGHRASTYDRAHYHFLIEADGTVVRGIPSIALNAAPLKAGHAEHTRKLNTDSIAVSLCCMADALEGKSAGRWPMTRAQWSRAADVGAILCRRYAIPVGLKTTLSHAEVEPNLGIRQLGKWDFTCLPFESLKPIGAVAVGNILRHEITSRLGAG